MINPVQLTKAIVAAFSLLGELTAVMRSNNVPLKRKGRLSASKSAVSEGSTAWECDRGTQARLMLAKYGKPVNTSTVAEMEKAIENADAAAKAGYAIEKAFSLQMDDLHKHFLSLEKGAKVDKGVEGKAMVDAIQADALAKAKAKRKAAAKAKAEMKAAIRQTEEQLQQKAA